MAESFEDALRAARNDSQRLDVARNFVGRPQLNSAEQLRSQLRLFQNDSWRYDLWVLLVQSGEMERIPWDSCIDVFHSDSWRHDALRVALQNGNTATRMADVGLWYDCLCLFRLESWRADALRLLISTHPQHKAHANEPSSLDVAAVLVLLFSYTSWRMEALRIVVPRHHLNSVAATQLLACLDMGSFEKDAREWLGLQPKAHEAGSFASSGGTAIIKRPVANETFRVEFPNGGACIRVDGTEYSVGMLIFNSFQFTRMDAENLRLIFPNGQGCLLGCGQYTIRGQDLFDDQMRLLPYGQVLAQAAPLIAQPPAPRFSKFTSLTQADVDQEARDFPADKPLQSAACVECKVRPRGEAILLPCKHALFCKTCSLMALERNSCMRCQQPVEKAARIFG